MSIKGSCLCGAVRFEVRATRGPLEICHCTRCRKASGAQGMPGLVVRTEDFELLAGHDSVTRYEAPLLYGPPAYEVTFCTRCGSPVPNPAPEGDHVEIPAGLLDDDPGFDPDKHIFVDFLPAWDRITDDLPKYTMKEIVKERSGRDLPADFTPRRHQLE